MLLLSVVLNAQNVKKDTIEFKANFWGYKFLQKNKRITLKEVLKKTEQHKESYQLIKKAKTQKIMSSIFSFSSGILLGTIVANHIQDKKVNGASYFIAGGGIAAAYLLEYGFKKNIRKAFELYNTSEKPKSYAHLNLIATNKGIGIALQF